MICQKCNKNPATAVIQQTINGHTTTLHLCHECASKQSASLWNGFDLHDFWGSLFAEPSTRAMAETLRCEGCGHTFREIANSGKAGCAKCYTTFYDRLLPSIERIHGRVHHVGKTPSSITTASASNDDVTDELTQLKERLQQCIDKQEYEECATLRDRIQKLEGKE